MKGLWIKSFDFVYYMHYTNHFARLTMTRLKRPVDATTLPRMRKEENKLRTNPPPPPPLYFSSMNNLI